MSEIERRMRTAEVEVALALQEREKMLQERNEAYATIYDMLEILGFDHSGDVSVTWQHMVASHGHRWFLDLARIDVQELRADYLDLIKNQKAVPSDPAPIPYECDACNSKDDCDWTGYWGATGVMPPSHHWHKTEGGGYLAHGEGHPGYCAYCGKQFQSDDVILHMVGTLNRYWKTKADIHAAPCLSHYDMAFWTLRSH